ncbi:MAG: hypothetical protein KGZ75_04345 [Syntrophomonadaceae bacterium]|nr:hypothetical protein [Syntrophomonadaceae bacterium]
MAITPKHSFNKNKRNYIATKKFTDREEPKKSFRNHVIKVKESNFNHENKYDVLVYYGVGGVGKSSLIRQLNKEIIEDYPKSLVFNLDFRDQINTSPARALLELINSQKGQAKGRFTHFEVAYSVYFIKRHPDIAYNEKSIPFVSELGIIADIIGNISGVGLIGSVTGVVNQAYKMFNKLGLKTCPPADT